MEKIWKIFDDCFELVLWLVKPLGDGAVPGSNEGLAMGVFSGIIWFLLTSLLINALDFSEYFTFYVVMLLLVSIVIPMVYEVNKRGRRLSPKIKINAVVVLVFIIIYIFWSFKVNLKI